MSFIVYSLLLLYWFVLFIWGCKLVQLGFSSIKKFSKEEKEIKKVRK